MALIGPELGAHLHLILHKSLSHPQRLGTGILPNGSYRAGAFCFKDSHISLLEIICSNLKGTSQLSKSFTSLDIYGVKIKEGE